MKNRKIANVNEGESFISKKKINVGKLEND